MSPQYPPHTPAGMIETCMVPSSTVITRINNHKHEIIVATTEDNMQWVGRKGCGVVSLFLELVAVFA